MITYMGYQLSEQITPGTWTVRIPHSLSASRFVACRELIEDSGILEDDRDKQYETWTVTIRDGEDDALRNLRYAEAKYAITVTAAENQAPAISDQDRQLAEDTFGLIERSEHVQADQPAVTPDDEPEQAAPFAPGHLAKRQGIIKGLRDLADALEQKPELPTPYSVEVDLFWQIADNGGLGDDRIRPEHGRAAMAAMPGDWSKNSGDAYISYDRAFGPDVTYGINVDRAEVCRRVQVGTRNVPARDEPVYEWQCDPAEDVSMVLAEHTAPALDTLASTWTDPGPHGLHSMERD
jgi:hypothetical protein